MDANEIIYIDNLIFTSLAQHRNVEIPGLGSLKCTLQPTTKNLYNNITEFPKYSVDFCLEPMGTSVAQLIVIHASCDIAEAQEMFEEWLGAIKKRGGMLSIYTISNVGIIICDENKMTFKEDKELVLLLNPLIMTDDFKPVVYNSERDFLHENITAEKAISEKTECKKIIFIIISIFVIGIMAYIATSFMLKRNISRDVCLTTVNKEVITKKPSLNTDSLTIDTVNILADTVLSVNNDTIVVKGKKDLEQYHIIIGTFSKKKKATELFSKLSLESKKIYLLDVPKNKKTPYYISIGKYNSLEEARKQLNIYYNDKNDTYESPWIFKY